MQCAWAAVTVLGFALERAALESEGRRLDEERASHVCFASCDAGHDSHCDQQDAAGRYTLSCDMHPTTSCDADCHPVASPPMAPWLGTSGTYPSPPPPPSPPGEELLIGAWIFFAVALLLFLCAVWFLCWRSRGRARDGVAYWCCCLLPLFKKRESRWEGGDSVVMGMPPALMLSDR